MGLKQLCMVVLRVLVELWRCQGCWEEERIALLQLKASFNYPNGTSLPTWGQETHCCTWGIRVECNNTTGRVTKLFLMNTRDQDSADWYLNTSLFLPFRELRILDLSGNRIVNCVENEGFDKLARLGTLEILDLSLNNFGNNILSSLRGLSSLKSLHLYEIGLKGIINIQEFNNLTSLKKLGMASNEIEGFKSFPGIGAGRIPRLSNLELLSLSDNLFDNSILSYLSGLSSLQALFLGFNKLKGSLNIEGLCKLKNLQELHINKNNLNGTVPLCLANLTSLQFLDLSYNQFSGNISLSPLRSLTSIEFLSISDNHFKIPISLSPFFNHSNLKYFYSSNNELYEEIEANSMTPKFQLKRLVLSSHGYGYGYGGAFPTFLYHQYNLTYIHLSNIEVNGEFPFWLLDNNTNIFTLELINNALTGPLHLPTHLHMNLIALDVSYNNFHSQIPTDFGARLPSLCYLYMSRNDFNGSIPSSFSTMNSLELLQMDGNQITGSIPDSLSNSSSLVILDISENHLSGMIPRWMGNMSSLEVLDLSNNNISGSLPSGFNPPHMRHVYLTKNRLEGSFSDAFYNCSELMTLDLSHNGLSGNIPGWIGKLSQLTFLLLSHNNLRGEIPVQLCKLEQLHLIDLSYNNFLGPVLACLKSSRDWSSDSSNVSQQEPLGFTTKSRSYSYGGSTLKYISGIDLSCNNLIGEIPPEFGNLSKIQALNLSHNSLTGPIPPAFSNLKEIESLDLSFNNLNGNIPPQLTQLYSLAVFSIAHNNLSGKTPDRVAQFATFDKDSYEENPFLCGLPLPKNCSGTVPPPSAPTISTDDKEDNSFVDKGAFYVTFLVSYFMVMLGIASVLYINPRWRQAWFYFIGESINRCHYFLVDNLPGLARFRFSQPCV